MTKANPPSDQETVTKHCGKCRAVKPLDDFRRSPYHSFGRHSWCKPCVKESERIKRSCATITQADEARFWGKVQKSDGCWEWQGPRSRYGYGKFKCGYRTHIASRFAYKLAHRVTLTPDQVVCHTRDNPPCCNPAHLFLGTQADNLRDMVAKGRRHSSQEQTQ